MLDPGREVYNAFIIKDEQPNHCTQVVRVILNFIRNKRAKLLGLKAELSDDV